MLNSITLEGKNASKHDWREIFPATDKRRSNGYITALRTLQITCGVAYGDEVSDVDDLCIGDYCKVSGDGANLPVSYTETAPWRLQVFLEHAEIGPSIMTGQALNSVILMSEFGSVIAAREIRGWAKSRGGSFLLHREPLAAIADYAIIDIKPEFAAFNNEGIVDATTEVLEV